MQPVTFMSDVQPSSGTWGFSALVRPFSFTGKTEPERKTMLYLRGFDGITETVVILDAAAVVKGGCY